MATNYPVATDGGVRLSIFTSIGKDNITRIAIKPDAEGNFSSNAPVELYNKMLELSKKHKLPIKAYQPDPKGTTPVVLRNPRFGNAPYFALLSAEKSPSKPRIVKLA